MERKNERVTTGRMRGRSSAEGLPPASGMAAIYPTLSRLVPANPASS